MGHISLMAIPNKTKEIIKGRERERETLECETIEKSA